MNQALKEYADWAEEEAAAPAEDPVAELMRARKDEAQCALRTWLVPVADDIDRCIREKYLSRILQEMNLRLVNGDLSQLLGIPVVSERIEPREMEMGSVTCWRLNRTDFLADVDLSVTLTVEK